MNYSDLGHLLMVTPDLMATDYMESLLSILKVTTETNITSLNYLNQTNFSFSSSKNTGYHLMKQTIDSLPTSLPMNSSQLPVILFVHLRRS